MTNKVRKAIMIRSKLGNKFLKDKNKQSRNDYLKQRNLCVTLICRARRQYFSSVDPNMVANNKKFWKTINPLISDKISHRYRINLTKGRKIITEDLQIAEIFSSYLSNVIPRLCDRNVPIEPGNACFQNSVSTEQSINSKIIPEFSLLIKSWKE